MIRIIISVFTSSRFVLFAFLLSTLLSCTAERERQNSLYKKFQHWDSLTVKSPAKILDSLGSVNNNDLSKENLMYKSLLICIASYWSETSLDDSTIMPKVVNWYRKNEDYRNLSRALIFSSKVKCFDKWMPSSIKYKNLLEADSIFYKNKVNDILTEAMLNKCMGISIPMHEGSKFIKTFTSTLTDSEKYIDRAIKLFDSLGLDRQVQLILLDKITLYGGLKDEIDGGVTKENLFSQISSYDTLDIDIRQKFYTLMIHHYISKENHEQALHYCNKYISELFYKDFKGSLGPVYIVYDIVNCHMKLNQPDSAYRYIQLGKDYCIDNAIDTTIFLYPAYINYYLGIEDYKNAYQKTKDYYTKSQIKSGNIFQSFRLNSNHKINELQKKLNVSAAQKKSAFIIGIVSSSLLVLLLVTSIVIIPRSRKRYREKVRQSETALLEASALCNRLWLTNEILKVSENLTTSFVEEAGKEVARCRASNPAVYKSITEMIDNLRTNTKDHVSNIVKNEAFINLFPDIASLDSGLSSFEKLILALYDSGYDTKEIASLLENTPAGIRAFKYRIKDKLLSISDLPFNPFLRFPIISKDNDSNP